MRLSLGMSALVLILASGCSDGGAGDVSTDAQGGSGGHDAGVGGTGAGTGGSGGSSGSGGTSGGSGGGGGGGGSAGAEPTGCAAPGAAISTPELFAAEWNDFATFTLAGGDVYWSNQTESGDLNRAPKTGGAPSVIASGLRTVTGIVPQSNAVIVSLFGTYPQYDDGGILSIPLSGAAPTVLDVGEPVYAMEVGATKIFGSEESRIFEIPLSGGPRTTVQTGLEIRMMLVDTDQTLYFIDNVAQGGALYKLPPSGPAVMLDSGGVASGGWNGDLEPGGLAMDATHVYYAYWPDKSPGCTASVRKIAKSGGAPATLAAGQAVYGLAVDATHVYFTNVRMGGEVMRVSKDGSDLTVFVDDVNYPDTVAVDDTHVYFHATSSQSLSEPGIWRAPK